MHCRTAVLALACVPVAASGAGASSEAGLDSSDTAVLLQTAREQWRWASIFGGELSTDLKPSFFGGASPTAEDLDLTEAGARGSHNAEDHDHTPSPGKPPPTSAAQTRNESLTSPTPPSPPCAAAGGCCRGTTQGGFGSRHGEALLKTTEVVRDVFPDVDLEVEAELRNGTSLLGAGHGDGMGDKATCKTRPCLVFEGGQMGFRVPSGSAWIFTLRFLTSCSKPAGPARLNRLSISMASRDVAPGVLPEGHANAESNASWLNVLNVSSVQVAVEDRSQSTQMLSIERIEALMCDETRRDCTGPTPAAAREMPPPPPATIQEAKDKENAALKAETPKAQAEDEVPKAEAKAEAPKAQAEEEVPKAEAKAEAPKAEAEEAPQAEADQEAPEAESEEEAPEAEADQEAPEAEAEEEVPKAEAKEAPEAEAKEEVPKAEAEVPKAEAEAPKAEAEEEAPEAEAEEEAPQAEAEEEAPKAEAEDEAQKPEAKQEAPKAEVEEEAPQAEAEEEAPQAEEEEEAPEAEAEEEAPQAEAEEEAPKAEAEEEAPQAEAEEEEPKVEAEEEVPTPEAEEEEPKAEAEEEALTAEAEEEAPKAEELAAADIGATGCLAPTGIDFTSRHVGCHKERLEVGEECEPQCWEGYRATRRPVCLGHGALVKYQCQKYDCDFEEEPSLSGLYCGIIRARIPGRHNEFLVAPSTRYPANKGFLMANYIPGEFPDGRMETVVAPFYQLQFSYIMEGADASLEVLSLHPRTRTLNSTLWSSAVQTGDVVGTDGPWKSASLTQLAAGFVTDDCYNTIIQFIARGHGEVGVDSIKFSVSDSPCEEEP